MGTLAARARLSKQTMTTLVRLAERDGLVARTIDATDRRATRVWLTPLAIDFAPIAGEVVDELQRSVEAKLGSRRTRSLEHMLGVIMNL
jgi:DNA-binding MarR family transcriptional regulator